MSLASECPAQGKLDQARSSGRADNLAERIRVRSWSAGPCQILLVIGDQRSSEVRMIPQVKEVRSEAQVLSLGELEVLDEREIPVLLEGAAINISAEIAESSGAIVGIGRALGWIQARAPW